MNAYEKYRSELPRLVRTHLSGFTIRLEVCAVLQVSRSGYYAWQDRPEGARVGRDRELLAAIWRVHAESRQAYGAKKTWLQLRDEGVISASKNR